MNNKSLVRLCSLPVTFGGQPGSNKVILLGKAINQSGAVLIISLIMLLLLTLIGTTAMQTSTLEEKMAGNLRDRDIAFQAAESALRDAENDIAVLPSRISGFTNFAVDCGAATASTTDNGLCYNGAVNEYSPAIWTTVSMTAAPSVAFGSITGATAIPNVSAQPRYIIEGLPGAGVYYRITARAQGINANTVVWLQSIYKP